MHPEQDSDIGNHLIPAFFALVMAAGLSPLIPGDNDINQLGATIALLGSIEPVWPGVAGLPDYGKVGDMAGVPASVAIPHHHWLVF